MSHEVTDFQSEVLERSRTVPVVVDFWAAWCGPCRVLGPVIERLAGEAGGRWELAKVDTERHPEVSERYGVTSIPNVKLFMDGQVVDEFVGALPEAEIRRWLESAIPSPHAGAVGRAAALIEDRRFGEAAVTLREVLEAEPGNAEARLRLAEAQVHTEPQAVAATLAPLAEDHETADVAEALATLARVVTLAGDAASPPAGEGRARSLEGAAAVTSGDYDAALAAFIEVLKSDRGYAGGLAKDAARSIFVLLGIRHPVCERHHRAFSSALHV